MKKFFIFSTVIGVFFALTATDAQKSKTPEEIAALRKEAESGSAEAQKVLGLCCINGNGVDKNLSEAVKWYRKAAEQGHAGAKKVLNESGR